MNLHIDGDVVLWKVCTTAINEIHGRIFFDNTINKYFNYLKEYFPKISGMTIYLTSDDRSNFRYTLPSEVPYKDNRKSRTKPEIFHGLKQYVLEAGAEMAYGCEADDLIASAATTEGETSIIVSNDKDYRQVENCWHWETNEHEIPYFVTNPGYLVKRKAKKTQLKVYGAGSKWFYYQVLAGDSGDHVPGIRGVGNAKAFDTLDSAVDEKDMWLRVKTLYEESGSTEQRAIENARLLWLRRSKNEPLWLPPKGIYDGH